MRDNFYLKIAKTLLDNRELATELAHVIYYALDSLDGQIRSILDFESRYSTEEEKTKIKELKEFWSNKYFLELCTYAGILNYNPRGCQGEETYKFIQDLTQNYPSGSKENFTQAEFNQLTQEDDD
jgi:hypothetical protein